MSGPSAPRPPIVVTGATGAIGGAAARALLQRGAGLVLLTRQAEQGPALREVLGSGAPGPEVVGCDLGSLASIRTAAEQVRREHPRLSGLLHVAAVYVPRREETADGLERMFATNYLAPFALTQELLPCLRAGAPARVVTVSAPSTTRLDFEDLQSSRRFRPLNAFGASKAANLLFAYELARRLNGSGIVSNVFFPGLVRSRLMARSPALLRGLVALFSRSPRHAGEALAALMLDPPGTANGRYFHLRRLSETSAYSRDPEVQRKLWTVSEQLLRDRGIGA